jgi:beta-lactamase regulating signal transducer with metallopeptidase domain
MIWQGLFDPTLSARICLTLLHSLWQIAIVACVAWGAERLLRRRSVEREYGIQVLALFVSLLLPPLTFAWLGTGEQRSSFSPTATHIVRSAASEKGPALGGKQSTTALVPAFSETSHDASPAAAIGSPTVADRAAVPLWMRYSPWVAAVYGMGVVVMLARLAAGVVYARRLARRGGILREGPLVDCARAVAAVWSMRAVPAIVQVEEIVIPKVVGLVWARILVPAAAMSGLSPSELEMLLIHELAHVRRHDMWINLLQRLAEMVLFFNPAIWLLSRRISGLREYCCDEVACREITHRHSEPRVQYARTLLRVVELSWPALDNRRRHTKADEADLVALSARGRSPSELRRRISRLFGEPLREPLHLSSGSLVAIYGLALLLLLSPQPWRTVADSSQAPRGQSAKEAATFADPDPAAAKSESTPARPQRTQAIRGANYLILPPAEQGEKSAYVMIDGNSLYTPDGKFDETALDWNKLAEQLHPFSDFRKGVVTFHVYNFSVNAKNIALAGWTLEGYGQQQAGFHKTYITQTFTGSGSFWKMIDTAESKMADRDEGPETPVGNNLVQVYPVRTLESFIKKDQSNCIVEIRPMLDHDTGNHLPADVLAAIKEYVPKVDVKHKAILLFQIHFKKGARNTVEWFRETGSKELARSLHYEIGHVSTAEFP